MVEKDGHTEGRLRSRPASEPPGEAPSVGLRRPGLDARTRGDDLLYVPPSYRLCHPAPLVVLLHGAGANSGDVVPYLRDLADAAGLILLAPTSREYTWDLLTGREFGGVHVVPPGIAGEAVYWFAAGQDRRPVP
jgi:phospholipase/carboxylesterase